MRKYVGINLYGTVFAKEPEFFRTWITEKTPIAYRSLTWLDALYEMFPDLSKSEVNRRVKSGAFSPGEVMTLTEAKSNIGIKPHNGKGFDWQVIHFGKLRGIVICSQELSDIVKSF